MSSIRILAAPLAAAIMVHASGVAAQTLDVWKTASCGCCSAWIAHIEQNGFSARARDVAAGQLAKIKAEAGLPPELQSCHTAKIDGYVIEGHVPAADIRRLLSERPDAIGLTVPGMPVGRLAWRPVTRRSRTRFCWSGAMAARRYSAVTKSSRSGQ